jgi:hypothetical protein
MFESIGPGTTRGYISSVDPPLSLPELPAMVGAHQESPPLDLEILPSIVDFSPLQRLPLPTLPKELERRWNELLNLIQERPGPFTYIANGRDGVQVAAFGLCAMLKDGVVEYHDGILGGLNQDTSNGGQWCAEAQIVQKVENLENESGFPVIITDLVVVSGVETSDLLMQPTKGRGPCVPCVDTLRFRLHPNGHVYVIGSGDKEYSTISGVTLVNPLLHYTEFPGLSEANATLHGSGSISEPIGKVIDELFNKKQKSIANPETKNPFTSHSCCIGHMSVKGASTHYFYSQTGPAEPGLRTLDSISRSITSAVHSAYTPRLVVSVSDNPPLLRSLQMAWDVTLNENLPILWIPWNGSSCFVSKEFSLIRGLRDPTSRASFLRDCEVRRRRAILGSLCEL